jgi:hypothetical protein
MEAQVPAIPVKLDAMATGFGRGWDPLEGRSIPELALEEILRDLVFEV